MAEEKIKLICRQCHFKFSWKKGFALKCPYCNSKNLERDKTTASQILRDVSMIPER